MPVSHIDELFQKSLEGDYDDDLPWNAVWELRKIGSREVFDKATDWCQSPDALCRARGADILAQIGQSMETHANAFPDEALAVITRLLECETDLRAIESAIVALGHIRNPEAIPLVVGFSNHPDCDVRYGVAFALGSFADDPLSIEHLMTLSRDEDEDVRDWATFGLGVLGEVDTAEIRDTLWARVEDPFEDARMEALEALGKRKDLRIAPILQDILNKDEVSDGYIEAANLLLGIDDFDREQWKTPEYLERLRKLCP